MISIEWHWFPTNISWIHSHNLFILKTDAIPKFVTQKLFELFVLFGGQSTLDKKSLMVPVKDLPKK